MASDKRGNRSNAYQHLFAETICSNDMMESFCNEDSIYNRLTGGFFYDETLMELEDELKEEFWRVVELLTPRQKQIVRLYADGYTQMEIAKILKVNQSSITKSINGNVDYKNGKRIYGGTKKKIDKIIQGDDKIKNLLARIRELKEEKW